jgi:hypothetical protein
MKPHNEKKPAQSVNMATDTRSQRYAYCAPDYTLNLSQFERCGRVEMPKMKPRDSAVVERRLEPSQTPHLRFVGRPSAKTTKHYSVDLDEFQS